MKAIILARVSDKKQDSNEAQVNRVSDYINRAGLTIWKTYEIEESSTKGDRRKYQEAVADVEKAKETIAIVVDTVDRLQRSFKESVQLDELRKAGKLEIHFYREGLVLRKDSNSSELLRWDMAVMFARSYVLQLSDNVKRKQEQMRRSGEWTGRPPRGYVSVHDSLGKRIDIIADPNKAHLIQKMFELYATGNYSIKAIRDLMLKEGLRGSTGKALAMSMVDHILHNTFYYGEMCSKGKLYPHKYVPLITKELFDRCKRVRDSWNKKPFQYAAKPYIFRGLIRCAVCGCAMSPEMAKGKYVYYSCTNAKKDLCSKKVYIPEKELLKPVYEVLGAFNRIPQETIDEIVEGLKESNESKGLYHSNALEVFQKEYLNIQSKVDRLMDLLLDSSITKDDYDRKLKELKEKQYGINIQIEDHTRADETYYVTASTVFNLAKNALSLFESSEVPEKRALLNYLLQNYTVNGKTPAFSLRSPFDTILSVSTQPIGLPEHHINIPLLFNRELMSGLAQQLYLIRVMERVDA
jgi:site-specific DNA recombinase